MSSTSSRLALLLVLPLAVVACSSADVGSDTTAQSPSASTGTVSTPASTPSPPPATSAPPTASSPPATGSTTNRAPTITGTPATSVRVGQAYTFQPAGADADGDTLVYAIANRPAWATFDTATGRLTGTPAAGNVGTTAGVVISVSDGKTSTALPGFSLAVTAATSASTTLTWELPTLNDDASPLTTLAGFRIVYGTSSVNLDRTVQVANPTVTSHVVENLTPGTWFFAVKAYNAAGVESVLSGIASQVIP